MSRSLAVAVALWALAVPASASAATLTVDPAKPCYSSREAVNLLGAGFSPESQVSVSRDGTPFSSLPADLNGAFNGVLRFAQDRGTDVRTYTATDGTDPSLSASVQVRVSAVRVDLTPANGAPGRVMTLRARGFTTGDTLWAHVTKGKRTRNLRIGTLEGACGALTARRRLLRRDAALGVHRIQFDTFRRFRRNREVQDTSTISVTAG